VVAADQPKIVGPRRPAPSSAIPYDSFPWPITAITKDYTPGQRDLDESTFPILWSADGYRSPWIDHYLSETEQFFNSESASVKRAVDFSAINTEPWNAEPACAPGS
jgi:hypothetical protein